MPILCGKSGEEASARHINRRMGGPRGVEGVAQEDANPCAVLQQRGRGGKSTAALCITEAGSSRRLWKGRTCERRQSRTEKTSEEREKDEARKNEGGQPNRSSGEGGVAQWQESRRAGE